MWWRLAALGLLAVTTAVYGQELGIANASPKMPTHLIECYRNDSIFHRANRLPMTLQTFLDLVRLIETSRSGQNMNSREIAANLIFYLKMDGIERSSSTQQQSSPDVLPFGISGQEYFRHRLMLVKLLQKPSQQSYQWLLESLTVQEMCNLHFMLSYSIDAFKRDDENCGNFAPESYNRGGRYYREVATEEKPDEESDKEEEDKNTQVEVLPPAVVLSGNNEGKAVNETNKGEFTVGRHELLTNPLESPLRGAVRSQRIPAFTNSNSPGRIYTPPYERSQCPVENGVIQTAFGSVTIGTVISGILAGLQRQQIVPREFGVLNEEIRPDIATARVDNLWAATLSGDVANMIMETSSIAGTTNGIGGKGGWNNTADPKWYLLQKDDPGHVTDAKLRGALDGLWLGQKIKELLATSSNLRLSQILDMYYSPVATIPNVNACNRQSQFNSYAPDADLSTQLEVFSIVMQRQQIKPSTITDFSALTSQALRNVKDYIGQLNSDASCQRSFGETTTAPKDFFTQLAIVIDSSWPYEALMPILTELSKREILASPFASNTTIICGMDGKILTQARDFVSFTRNFTTTTMNSCARGLNLGAVYYSLRVFYRGLYQNEKIANKIQRGSFVTLLMPYSSSSIQQNSTSDMQTFKTEMPDIKFLVATNGAKDSFNGLVDNVQTDAFTIRTPTANDPSAIDQIKAVATAVSNVPNRLSLPECASYWADASSTKGVLSDDVRLGYTKTYKLHPNYFHKSEGKPKISVRGTSSTSGLVVCLSRTDPNPTGNPDNGQSTTPNYNNNNPYNPNNNNNPYNPNNNNNPYNPNNNNNPYNNNGYNNYNRRFRRQTNNGANSNCKTINTATTDFYLAENPCNDKRIFECEPAYLSVTAPLSSGTPQGNCNNCRFPTNAQYEVSIEGLSCDSGVGQLLSNPIAMLISTIAIIAASFL